MNMEGRANGTTNLQYELPFLGRVQTNIHAQFASFTYFFIALPGLILASKVLTWNSASLISIRRQYFLT